MKAIPIQRLKQVYAGGMVEINIWHVSSPILPCAHSYKYRLVYVVEGTRVIGYDNERGKGDHRHTGDAELPYIFADVATLLADFWHDVVEIGDRK